MCEKPSVVFVERGPRYERIEVPCRRCRVCLLNRENDLVGRALCEVATSDWAFFLTLTYGDERLRHWKQKETIVKQDLQNFFKLVRKDYKCRYLAAGEFGERKGRSHFHVLLMGVGIPPKIALEKEYWHWEPYWPWGFTWAENGGGHKPPEYIAKYLNKSKRNVHDAKYNEEWVTYSRKPLLGYEFIIKKARRQAEMKVFPQTFNYNPPLSRARRRYSFYGKAQEVFFDEILRQWPEAATQVKTEWMQNAWRRYLRAKAEQRWRKMCITARQLELEKWLDASRASDYKMWDSVHEAHTKQLLEDRRKVQKWLEARDARRAEAAYLERALKRLELDRILQDAGEMPFGQRRALLHANHSA